MATITAIGPAFAVDGPLPVPPAYRLLSVPGVLVAESDRILNGVNVWGYPCDLPSGWDPCGPGEEGPSMRFGAIINLDPGSTKENESDWNIPRFDSFQLYLPIECYTGHTGDPAEFAARAVKVLDATVSAAVEAALSNGAPVTTNPFFGDVNMAVINGGVSVPVATGLAYLEEAIAATGRQGLIHLTPPAAAALGYSYLQEDGLSLHVLGSRTPVSVGQGYVGAQPVMYGAAAAGQSWIFATGPVRVYMTPTELVAPSVSESLDRSDNTLTYRAETDVVAYWDGCLQVGALVDWSP